MIIRLSLHWWALFSIIDSWYSWLIDTNVKLLNVGQSVAVTVQASNGLGKHLAALDNSQISAYSKVNRSAENWTPTCTRYWFKLKATYTGNILYISGLCLSELSVLLFVRSVTPVQWDKHMLLGVGSITVIWTLIAIIVSAAECGSPTPWNNFTGHCIDGVSLFPSRALNIPFRQH